MNTAEIQEAGVENTEAVDPTVDARRDQIREIQAALGEVNPLTLEEWEEAFRLESQPEREIAYWLNAGRTYRRCLARFRNMALADRRECLHAILAAADGDLETAIQNAVASLSRESPDEPDVLARAAS